MLRNNDKKDSNDRLSESLLSHRHNNVQDDAYGAAIMTKLQQDFTLLI